MTANLKVDTEVRIVKSNCDYADGRCAIPSGTCIGATGVITDISYSDSYLIKFVRFVNGESNEEASEECLIKRDNVVPTTIRDMIITSDYWNYIIWKKNYLEKQKELYTVTDGDGTEYIASLKEEMVAFFDK